MSDLTLSIKFSTVGGQTVVKSVESLKTAVQGANQELKGTNAAGQLANQGLQKAALGSKQLTEFSGGARAEIGRLRDHMHQMVGIGAAFYAAMAAGAKALEFVKIADEFNVLQQRIRTATAETNDYNAVSAEMYAIAQRNGAALGSTVELFQRLATSRKDLKATNDQMLNFTDAVQKLGVIGGSSTQALDAGLMQLSQGLSGGVLRAEEFNSLLENIPELASRIGKGMDDIGKSDNELGLGDLRKLVLEGKLLSEDVLQSILVQLPEIEKQFARMPISVGRAGIMMDNSFSSALSRLDSVTGSTQIWAEMLVSISQTLDSMSAAELQDAAATMLAIAGAGAALLFLSKYSLGLASVAGGYKSLVGWLNNYRTVQVATTTTIYNAANMTNLTVASTNAAARSFNMLAASANLAKGALAALGGPAGLALAAGSAIYYFASSAGEAETEVERLRTQVRSLTSDVENLGKVQAKPKLIEAQDILKLKQEAQALLQHQKEVLDVAMRNQALWGKGIDLKSIKEQERYRETIQQTADEYSEVVAMLELAGVEVDAYKEKVKALQDILKNGKSAEAPTTKPADTKALTDELLKLYNVQMLNAQAIDVQGRAFEGIDLELFKAAFKEASKLPQDAEAAIKKFFKTAEASSQLAANDKYLNGLKEEVRLQQIRLNQGEAEYELAKAMSSQKMTDPAQLKQLQAQLNLQRQLNQTKTQGDALKALKAENDLLEIRLTKGEKEYQLLKMIRDLKVADPAVIKQLDNEIERQRLLNEQLDVRQYLTDGSYDEVLDGLTKIGDAGSSVGNALVDSFGSVADQFARMAEQQDDFTKKFLTLSEARKKADKEVDPAKRAKALEKADATERQLMEDQTRLQMGNFASLAGAAGKLFSEQSKGRQVMHKLEVTFAAIETALAIKKAAANALAAISNQGSGDPYSAFARIAAMAAIMAGLGLFSGSASGAGISAEDRQKSQGTGTVLGDSDAKSESIANSLARIEDLELDQYAELRAINSSIRELSAGIKNLAVSLVASYGRFNESNYPGELGKENKVQLGSGLASFVGGGLIGVVADKLLGGLVGGITNKILGGLFGSSKKELMDSGISFASQQLGDIIASGLVNATVYDVIKTTKKKMFGLSKSSSENTEYRAMDDAVKAEFGRIFSHMGKSVTEAVKFLGLETSRSLENFVINLPNISFKDLSGDEIEKELQAIFSQQGDLMAQYLLPGIAEFQQMGEGLYETLIRVAQEQAVFNAALDNLGLSLGRFSGMTKALELQIAQSLIELMGGIEQFQAATADYFAEFYSESEQLAAITASAQAQFASLGIAMPGSRDAFKSLVDSLDLTTDAGQRMFAVLMALVPAMDQLYDAAEAAKKAAEQAAEQARKEAAEKAARARQIREDRTKYEGDLSNQLGRLDMSSLELALDDIRKWYAAQIEDAKKLGASTALLEQLYARKRQQIISSELDRINQDTERQMEVLTTEHARAVSELTSNYDQLFAAIKAAGDSTAQAILDIRRAVAGWQESAYQSSRVQALRGQLGSGDIASQVTTIEQLQQAIVARYQADLASNNSLMEAATAKLDALSTAWTELQSALGSVQTVIQAAMLDIRRSMSGWNETGYQSAQISNYKQQLGTGSVLEQINTVESLQQAIVARYHSELAANQQLQDVAQQRYQAELAAHKALTDAARQLLGAADAMRLSDFSPALMGTQFNESQTQFNQLLNKAQGGDVDAMRSLQGAGNSYLALARDFLASGSAEYAQIFEQVEQAYRSFANQAQSAEPVVPRSVLDYQNASTGLQQAAVTELETLQLLLTQLQANALASQTAAEAAARAEVAAIQAQQLELQQSAIAELTALQLLLDGLAVKNEVARDVAINALLLKLDEQKTALLAVAERQIAAIEALRPHDTPVDTSPEEPTKPLPIERPWDTPPIIIFPIFLDQFLPSQWKEQLQSRIETVNAKTDLSQTTPTNLENLLQEQLTEQRTSNTRQATQLENLATELQRTQGMLFESRRVM